MIEIVLQEELNKRYYLNKKNEENRKEKIIIEDYELIIESEYAGRLNWYVNFMSVKEQLYDFIRDTKTMKLTFIEKGYSLLGEGYLTEVTRSSNQEGFAGKIQGGGLLTKTYDIEFI